MKVALLSANLGNFDINAKDPVVQYTVNYDTDIVFHRFTDDNFPPVLGLSPRLQYRIPKMFGWQMKPGYDVYIWFDSSCSLQREDCVEWYLDQLGDNDMAFFRHPQRGTMKQEVDYIERKLQEGNEYIVSRYTNGFHKEMYEYAMQNQGFRDEHLYASTAFVYRNTFRAKEALRQWWYW